MKVNIKDLISRELYKSMTSIRFATDDRKQIIAKFVIEAHSIIDYHSQVLEEALELCKWVDELVVVLEELSHIYEEEE